MEIYWVRKGLFGCMHDELDEHLKNIKNNDNHIIFKIEEPIMWDTGCQIPVYYLEKADLASGSPYSQSAAWLKKPWTAPEEAVIWN